MKRVVLALACLLLVGSAVADRTVDKRKITAADVQAGKPLEQGGRAGARAEPPDPGQQSTGQRACTLTRQPCQFHSACTTFTLPFHTALTEFMNNVRAELSALSQSNTSSRRRLQSWTLGEVRGPAACLRRLGRLWARRGCLTLSRVCVAPCKPGTSSLHPRICCPCCRTSTHSSRTSWAATGPITCHPPGTPAVRWPWVGCGCWRGRGRAERLPRRASLSSTDGRKCRFLAAQETAKRVPGASTPCNMFPCRVHSWLVRRGPHAAAA